MNHKITLKMALLVLTVVFVSACQTTQTEDILVDPATDGQGQTDGSIAGQDGSADSSTSSPVRPVRSALNVMTTGPAMPMFVNSPDGNW